MTKKVTFLFGAGADSVYDICKGASFIEPLLLGKYTKERKELLGDANGTYTLLHSRSKWIYFQTISSNQEAARKVFGKDFTEKCIRYYNKECEEDQYFSTCCKNWFKMLKEGKTEESEKCSEEVRQFFLNHTVFFDCLDEKMNDLRNTPLNNNGKRVINAYATIFILMMKEVYNIDNKFSWNYENVFDCLCNKTVKNLGVNSYYQILKSHMDTKQQKNGGKDQRIFIATTNYTEIAECILGSDVAYLHGKLNWFEDYRNLTIYDCKNDEERRKALAHQDTLVPFILIPSGVKPIICKRQIEEFHKFINQLDKSDILCVLGYKFNSEDNHINSIIGEWLQNENRKLVYFNYKQELNMSRLEWMKERGEPIVVRQSEFSTERLSNFLKSQDKVLDVAIGQIDKDSDFTTFEEAVSCLVNH